MNYDKATLKKFIFNYHSIQKNDDINACNNDLSDFFEINNQVETDFYADNNIEDVILYNELEEIVEEVGADKEHYIFWLLNEGYSYKEIGNVFSVSAGRIGQIFDNLLKKLLKYCWSIHIQDWSKIKTRERERLSAREVR